MATCETVDKCCFSGRGKIWLAKYDACCGTGDEGKDPYPMLFVGNVTAFTIDATINDFSIEDMTSGAGGNACKYSEVADPVVNMDVSCLDPENFAKAMGAQQNVKAAATGETYSTAVRQKGVLIPLRDSDGKAVTNVKSVTSVTIDTDDGAGGTTQVTLVKGTDYVVTGSAIEILETAENIPAFPPAVAPATLTAGFPMTVTYDHDGYTLLDMLTDTGTEYSLFFDGINAAAGNAPFSGELFRIKPRPATGIPMISKELARWSMTADILTDSCKTSGSNYGTFGF